MVDRVADHARQLNRVGEDIGRLTDDSFIFGSLRIFRGSLYMGEVAAGGFGLYHLAHEIGPIVVAAFSVEVFIVIVHIIKSSFEKRLHGNHERRIDSLREELREKEDDLLGTAAAFELRIRRWYRRARRIW